MDFKEQLKRLYQRDFAVPRWFSADCRLGVITITLTAQSAFAAEAYSCTLRGKKFTLQSQEQRINYGLVLLHNLFGPLMEA